MAQPVRTVPKEWTRRLIIETLMELHEGAHTNQILKRIELRHPKKQIPRRTVLRRLNELVNDGTVMVTGYYVYSLRDRAKVRANIFQGHGFNTNLWPLARKLPNLSPKNLVEIFGVYTLFCFLETARANRNIRSYEDRMDLLLTMIDLKYGMYYRFVELLRGKPFEVVSGFENKDNDTLELSEETIAKWSQGLKKQYRKLYGPLESSAEMARGIAK